MKLRSKLFLSTSALLTVALLGLSLGIFSVLQLTQSQSRSLAHNLEVISTSLDLRQELGRQLFLMLGEDFDERTVQTLQDSDRRIRGWLDDSLKGSVSEGDRQAILEIQSAYQKFSTLLEDPMTVRHELLTNDDFAKTIETVRDRLNALQIRYVSAVKDAEAQSQERAWLISGLLGLVGLAVLVIGFITAHTIARRVGQPIDAPLTTPLEVAQAADRVTQRGQSGSPGVGGGLLVALGEPRVRFAGDGDGVGAHLNHPFPSTGARSRAIAARVPAGTSPECWGTVVW